MVLDFIESSINERGYPPTLREIGNYMGIRSTNGVNDHLRALERKGYLAREDMKSRALRPITASRSGKDGRKTQEPANDNVVEVPIVGRVAAGQLADAIENPENTLRVDKSLIGGPNNHFGLRIDGESMIKAGIHDGDYVFVRKQLDAQRGEIVVALVGDEATCKYYYPESDRIRLVPANDAIEPIEIQKNDWRSNQILGVVVGLYRKFS
jgi:repressor LexA